MQQSDFRIRPMRRPHAEIVALLDAIEDRPEFQPRETRNSPRYRYRAKKLTLEVVSPGGDVTRYDAVSRNISATGVSLAVGQFIYPGSTCRVRLISIHNYWQVVSGTIRRCRYLPGSISLYDVGIAFDEQIDVSRFHRAAGAVDVLLLSRDEHLAALIPRLSNDQPVKIETCQTEEELLKAANNERFPLTMLDMDTEGVEPTDLLKRLRAHGYLRPTIGIANREERVVDIGVDNALIKPLGPAQVTNAVVGLLDEPLISSLVHDSSMAELIDEFVNALPGVINDILGKLRNGHKDEARRAIERLRGQAGSYGFDVITEQADRALSAIGDEAAFQREMGFLIRWCLAAQPVNCSLLMRK